MNVADQEQVELDELGKQMHDVFEAGEAGAGIVDSEAHAVAAQAIDGTLQRLVVLDRGMLGDFHDQTFPVQRFDHAAEVLAQQGLRDAFRERNAADGSWYAWATALRIA